MKQGDICSPKASICFLEGVIRKMKTAQEFSDADEVLKMLLLLSADDTVLCRRPANVSEFVN